MKQANIIKVAVNPSNLIQQVRINDKMFKMKNDVIFKEDLFAKINNDGKDIKDFYENTNYNYFKNEYYEDKSFIKSLIPKNRLYGMPK